MIIKMSATNVSQFCQKYSNLSDILTKFLFPALFCIRYALPLLIIDDIPVIIHDNLDSEAVYSIFIGKFWRQGADSTVFDVFLGGELGWAYFSRILQPISLLYSIFTPSNAYILTEIIHIVVAYLSMNYLLLGIGSKLTDSRLLSCVYCFGLSYSSFGLGLAVAPLILYYSIQNSKMPTLSELLITGFCGLNTSLPLHAMFLPIVAISTKLMLNQNSSWWRLCVIQGTFLFAATIASSGLLFVLGSGIPTNRSEWSFPIPDNLAEEIWKRIKDSITDLSFLYHATFVPANYVATIIFLAIFPSPRSRFALIIVSIIMVIVSMHHALIPIFIRVLPGPMGTIMLWRIGYYIPLLMMILASISIIDSKSLFGSMLKVLIHLSLVYSLYIFITCALRINSNAIASAFPSVKTSGVNQAFQALDLKTTYTSIVALIKDFDSEEFANKLPTYKTHFRTREMSCLKSIIGQKRALSYGIDPMIAAANGINVVDGYHNLYPLSYKHRFRPIIATKLNSSKELAQYFDGWGSRLYTFADKASEVLPDFKMSSKLGASIVIADRQVLSDGLSRIEHNCSKDLMLYDINMTNKKEE